MLVKIEIIETLSRIIEVESNTEEQAENTVREQWQNEEIVLDYSDHSETEFIIIKEN